MKIKPFFYALLLLSIIFSAAAPAPAYASGTTHIVNSSDDTDDSACDNSHCSLREAVKYANPGDTIMFDPSITHIQLNPTDKNILINKNLTINGNGMHVLTIHASNDESNLIDNRVFTIAGGAVVTISDMTIRDGNADANGGGIQNYGTLTLERVQVTNNQVASDLGGGVYSEGDLTVIDSLIMFNTANLGGGIGFTNDSTATLTLTRTGIVHNTANFDGGGIWMSSEDAIHTFTNVTISNNSAGDEYGAAFFTDNDDTDTVTPLVKFIHVTVHDNQATTAVEGIHTDFARIESVSSIFSAPGGVACSDGGKVAGNGVSLGTNIATDNTCWFLTDPSDMTETDPKLKPLQYWVGGFNAISLNSPALDTANNTYCPGDDVRGDPRPVDGDENGISACDIGAFELNPSIRFVAQGGNDSGNNCLNAINPCATVGAAVIEAQDGDHIQIDPGVYPAALSINKSLIIKGADMNETFLDGGNANRVIFVYAQHRVILRDLAVQKGNAGDGGGIYSNGALEVENVQVLNNRATDYGGGVYVSEFGKLSMRSAFISGNETLNGSGGGIFTSAPSELMNVTISDNHANGLNRQSGGLHIQSSGESLLVNVTVSGNSAPYAGGATFTGLGNTTVVNSAFYRNEGNEGVGAYTDVTFHNTIIAHNDGYGQCFDYDNFITSGDYNIETENTCGFDQPNDQIHTDIKLLPLGNYGGLIPMHGITLSSQAMDAGDNIICPTTDARGVSRPQDGDNDSNADCDIGPFELEYNAAEPQIVSITRADSNPSAAANVKFTVTFDMPVAGVQAGDFELFTTGFTNAPTITDVSGGGMVHTITVNTGRGNGTIRLDVKADATIASLSEIAMTNLPYTDGEEYTINKISTFISTGAQDGWVLESSETSNKGGKINKGGKTITIGDDALNRQYRAILSFNTSTLPLNANITKVTLRIRRQGVTGGGNPITMFGGFMVDIKKGNFGKVGLQLTDFNASGKSYGAFKPKLQKGWYNINLIKGKAQINTAGNTQIRLRFKLDDNNNFTANFLSIHSGNAAAASRPQLIVEFSTP